MSKPNIEKRLTAARNRAYGALSVFETLAKDLRESAKHADTIAQEASQNAAYYENVRKDAADHAVDAITKAQKIEELFQ